jgi:dihydrofolate reductase
VHEFVTAGIHTARERATALAGERVVVVMGGADLGRQFGQAGLAEVISIHLVPVLLGGGTRLCDESPIDPTRLEVTEVVPGPTATHLRFRVPDPQTAHP